MDIVVSILLGFGLAAAVGFRVFVPFTFLSLAAMADMVELSPTWAWIGSYPALIAFGIATMLEIAAYYVPWLDNLLDSVAIPVTVVAGAIITASVTTDMSPLLTWTLAIIVGGGAAGIVQAGTTFLRGMASAGTLGAGNFLVSTAEWIAASLLALLAVLAPILAAVFVLALFILVVRRFRRRTRPAPSAES